MFVEVPITQSFNTSDNDPMTWTWSAAKDGEYVPGVGYPSASDQKLYVVLGSIVAVLVGFAVGSLCWFIYVGIRVITRGIGSGEGVDVNHGINKKYQQPLQTPQKVELTAVGSASGTSSPSSKV